MINFGRRTTLSCYLLSTILALIFIVSDGFDLAIYGKVSKATTVADAGEVGLITTSCFGGIGLAPCVAVLPDDDVSLRNDMLYYKALAVHASSAPYCVECCGTNPSDVDFWEMQCTLDFFTMLSSNLLGYEFRFARRQTTSDLGYVSCPLKRHSCTYDVNGVSIECPSDTGYYLYGYTLNLNVKEYHDNFNYWRGVDSCEAVGIEGTTSLYNGDIFTENIILTYTPAVQSPDDTYLLFLLLSIFLFIYAALYFCRKKHCAVCQKKLVLSKHRCYICILVGAYPPDPMLLAALEEKGERLQGHVPDNIPGTTEFMTWFDKYRRKAKKILIKFFRRFSRRANAKINDVVQVSVKSLLKSRKNEVGDDDKNQYANGDHDEEEGGGKIVLRHLQHGSEGEYGGVEDGRSRPQQRGRRGSQQDVSEGDSGYDDINEEEDGTRVRTAATATGTNRDHLAAVAVGEFNPETINNNINNEFNVSPRSNASRGSSRASSRSRNSRASSRASRISKTGGRSRSGSVATNRGEGRLQAIAEIPVPLNNATATAGGGADAVSVTSESTLNSAKSVVMLPKNARDFIGKYTMARRPRKLNYPKRIIFEAVGHPAPPRESEEEDDDNDDGVGNRTKGPPSKV